MTFICSVQGIVDAGNLVWVFNIHFAAETGEVLTFGSGSFSRSLCQQTLDYTLTNADENDTGVYSCFFTYSGGPLDYLFSIVFIEVVKPGMWDSQQACMCVNMMGEFQVIVPLMKET